MSPFAEQMQRDSIMGFVDRFANDPFFDGKKLRMTAAQAFDFPDPEGCSGKSRTWMPLGQHSLNWYPTS